MPEQRDTTARTRAALYLDATHILENEHDHGLALDIVASRLATSRRQLQRAFREVGRTTFRDQLTEVRMRHAAELLSRSSLTIAEIAREVGYRYPAQFSKMFQQYLGAMPSAYRRLNGRTQSLKLPATWH